MKKLLLASAAAAAFTTSVAQAQAPAPTPEHTVTGNMTIATDYRFRGISQTFGEGFFTPGPAIQGGIDYSHSSGFYLGNWNSNISGNQYPNGSSIEMDFYGGWKGQWDDFGLDVGTIYYLYPGGTKLFGVDSAGNVHHHDGEQLGGIPRRQLEVVLRQVLLLLHRLLRPVRERGGGAVQSELHRVPNDPGRFARAQRQYEGHAVPHGRVQLRDHAQADADRHRRLYLGQALRATSTTSTTRSA